MGKVINYCIYALLLFVVGCSTNSPNYCRNSVIYKLMDTANLCDTYLYAKDLSCDKVIIEEFNLRKLIRLPREECGKPQRDLLPQSNRATLSICTNEQKYLQMGTKLLCSIYFNNEDVVCNSSISYELFRRNAILKTKEECEASILNSDTKTTQPLLPSDIDKLCLNTFESITQSSNPIAAACDYRYKVANRESIKCRKFINEFININSNGVGNNLKTCGLK